MHVVVKSKMQMLATINCHYEVILVYHLLGTEGWKRCR